MYRFYPLTANCDNDYLFLLFGNKICTFWHRTLWIDEEYWLCIKFLKCMFLIFICILQLDCGFFWLKYNNLKKKQSIALPLVIVYFYDSLKFKFRAGKFSKIKALFWSLRTF